MPPGKPVPNGTPGAVKQTEVLAEWYGQGIPGLPPTKRVPLATHKRVAEMVLADLVERAERGVHGLPDRQPLAPLVAEFEKAEGRRAGEKAEAVNTLPPPRLGPRRRAFAHLTRTQLEAMAESLTITLAAVAVAVLTPNRDTHETEPKRDAGRQSGTEANERTEGNKKRTG